jgi:nascent polypeptide-associated complex subunit alpha
MSRIEEVPLETPLGSQQLAGKDKDKSKEKDDLLDDDDDDDDDVDLDDDETTQKENTKTGNEATGATAAGATAGSEEQKQSRGEKKARKALEKLGLKKVPGVSRVTIRKSKNILFVIDDPEVLKQPGTDTYVIFGVAKVEDLGSKNFENAASTVRNTGGAGGAGGVGAGAGNSAGLDLDNFERAAPAMGGTGATETAGASSAADDISGGGDEDETGLEPNDIDLVVEQTGKSRAAAVRALKKSGNDVVNAIMELSS